MDLTELSRRLENLVRIGTVHSVDHGAARCRVQSGDLVTQWLRWHTPRAGATRTWDPPTVGEQAIVISPSGEPANGMVFYGLNSDAIPAPSNNPDEHVIAYPDGARITYDHASSHLSVTGSGSITVTNGAGAINVSSTGPITIQSESRVNIVGASNVSIQSSGGTDTKVSVSGNSEIRASGYTQFVAEGAILIKSETGVRIQGPSGAWEI